MTEAAGQSERNEPRASTPDAPRASGFACLGFGAATLGNLHRAYSDEEAWELLETAWQLGIRHFDTAPHYGLGLSERRLGAFLRTKPRDEFTISTKVGRLLVPSPDTAGKLDLAESFYVPRSHRREWDFSAAGVRQSHAESLARLGLARVDTLYLHDPERGGHLTLALREGLPELARMREAGLVRNVGAGSMVTDALAAIAETGLADDLMVAGRYTLLEQPVLTRVWPALRRHGGLATVASVFNSGLLAAAHPGQNTRYDYAEASPQLLDRLEAIRAVCTNHGVPLPAAALHFPLRDALVRRVVLGAGRASQLRQNMAWLQAPVPDALWRELQAAELIP